MRSTATTLLLLFALAALLAPSAAAVPTFVVKDVAIVDTDGQKLVFIPLNDFVKVRITLNNTGVTTVDETVNVRITIESQDHAYKLNRTVTSLMKVASFNSTVVEFSWSPTGRQLGNHTITVDVVDSPQGHAARSFTVSKTAVAAGDLWDRILNYYWFFGAFLLAVVLFFVVLGARRS